MREIRARHIRVFISSTFRDMKGEREHLVKFIFPQLRKLCQSRGVVWGEVDLRWGIPDEQKAEGNVLPICLEEIKRCRPYFIGLLGERYGWIPEVIPPEVIEREPWLREHVHGRKSITELEILHAVLNDPDKAKHAFFYFRDPAYVESLPSSSKKDFAAEDPKSREKLRNLKDRIRQSHLPVREDYHNPKALGDCVLADLTAVIDKLFPEGAQPDPLEREAIDHEAYARSRERVYIGHPEYFTKLDAHADGASDQPQVILGESGCGKSALLANWVAHYRETHPDTLVVQHYIGATPYSADWAAMLRRILGEFRRRLNIQQEIPDKTDTLRSAFPNWLHMAAAKGRIVLVLDALNQLEDRDGAPDLLWLPPVMPENVRLIVSTLPGRPLDEIKRRNWPAFEVGPLAVDERKALIDQFLHDYGRALSAACVERIATAPQSANPLYLRVLLDELRVFGEHEQLDERITHYLRAQSPRDLYGRVITRWEEDYGTGKTSVSDTLSLLWAARRGLSETEVLQAIGEDGQPLPRAIWSPLYLAMSDALVSRGGLLTFAHHFLRAAVRDEYLPTEGHQRRTHLRLADYFQQQQASERRSDELPWQLAQASEWEKLYGLLTDITFLVAPWQLDQATAQFEVSRFWAQVEASSPYRMTDAYQPIIENPACTKDLNVIYQIARLLRDSGHVHCAVPLIRHLAHGYGVSSSGTLEETPNLLVTLSSFLWDAGEVESAFALNLELIKMCRKLGEKRCAAVTLTNQAAIWRDRGELHRALRLLGQATQLLQSSDSKVELADCLGKRADIHTLLQEYEQSARLLDEMEALDRIVGNQAGLAHCLHARGVIFVCQGRLDEAFQLHTDEEHLCRSQGDRIGLQRALGSQSLVRTLQGELDEALRLADAAMAVAVETGNKMGIACCHGVRGRILRILGRHDEAQNAQEMEETLAREVGNVIEIGASLAEQAKTARAAGRIAEADRLMAEYKQLLSETDFRSFVNGAHQAD